MAVTWEEVGTELPPALGAAWEGGELWLWSSDVS